MYNLLTIRIFQQTQTPSASHCPVTGSEICVIGCMSLEICPNYQCLSSGGHYSYNAYCELPLRAVRAPISSRYFLYLIIGPVVVAAIVFIATVVSVIVCCCIYANGGVTRYQTWRDPYSPNNSFRAFNGLELVMRKHCTI